MCGIFAYYGARKNAAPLIIEGLKKLEYRGYDSWGIAIKTDQDIIIHKQIGKIGDFDINEFNLDRKHKNINAQKTSIAIGHSRWATHGGVTSENAHPHGTENKDIVIVHNGIFENYLEVKERLKNHTFTSQTDTEVIAHLIEEYLKNSSLETAVKKAIKKIEGRYAILVISRKENKIIAARRGSPLILGKGDNEYFIASDIPAFLKYTNKVMYLDDNQMVTLDEKGPKFYDLENEKSIEKREIQIDWNEEMAEKGQYPHFMIKEIMEQKETLARAINQDENLIRKIAEEIGSAFGTYLVGCGTAGKVCMAAEYLFSRIAKKHINVTFGSEFPNHHHFLTNSSLMICVSQSGETADTLEAIEVAKKKGVKVISIVNVETSSMARISDLVLPIKAGPEKAVASTKATTSQLAILTLLAYACAGKLEEGRKLLIETASKINDMLNPRYEEHLQQLAEKIKNQENIYIIGRGPNYPIALESAIKLQEVSYIHAEGFAAGELKHGPIALISNGTPCIALVSNDETRKDTISNATEIKARGGYIIGISPEIDPIFDYWVRVPDAGNASPIVNIIPVQILAYQLAVLRNNDPDKPRNLAKSVTVK